MLARYALLLYCLITVTGLSSCIKGDYPYFSGMGLKPVYVSYEALDSIGNLAPQPIEKSGPIFLQGNYFFMIEQKKGIHIFSIPDTAKIGFINIPAVNDFTLAGNTLYADNGPNLLVIDISDIQNIKVKSRIAQSFQPLLYPQLYRGIFECGDEKKGIIVDWQEVYLDQAACNTQN